jgi:hypothetical protein
MKDPVRLRDRAGAAYATDLAVAGKTKLAYDAEKGHALLVAAISSPAAAGVAAPRWATWKIGLAAAGAIAVGGALVAALHHRGPPVAVPPPPVPEAPAVVENAPPMPDAGLAPSSSAPPVAAPSTLTAHSSSSSPRASASSGSSLAEETVNLAKIRATAASDPASALGMISDANQRFARGVFREEREAIAIGALARLGRASEARARGQRFLDTYPASALAAQVRRDANLSRRNAEQGQ